MMLFLLYDLLAVENDREGPLILYRNGHIRAKNTGLDIRDHGLAGCDDVLVQIIGQIRGAGIDERRAVAVVAVRVESELRDEKETSADIGEALIRFSFLVTEDAEPYELFYHTVGDLLRVSAANPDKYEESVIDRTDGLALDIDFGRGHSLDQKTHKKVLLFDGMLCRQHIKMCYNCKEPLKKADELLKKTSRGALFICKRTRAEGISSGKRGVKKYV